MRAHEPLLPPHQTFLAPWSPYTMWIILHPFKKYCLESRLHTALPSVFFLGVTHVPAALLLHVKTCKVHDPVQSLSGKLQFESLQSHAGLQSPAVHMASTVRTCSAITEDQKFRAP
eukprot:1157977-Pelagomonas_calceolata.AAC.8